MNIKTYLTRQLAPVDIERMKPVADMELQRLVDDRIIYFGECHYIRNAAGDRCGLQVAWTVAKESNVETHIIQYAHKNEKTFTFR